MGALKVGTIRLVDTGKYFYPYLHDPATCGKNCLGIHPFVEKKESHA